MKKVFLILTLIFTFLAAQEIQSDTSVTRLQMSDVKYYNIELQNMENKIDHEISEKPFAFKQPADKWFSKDKWMHLTSAYFLTLQSSYVLENMFYVEPENSRNISIGITLSFSLSKEFYDALGKKSIFSWKDLVYDILGTSLGYLTAGAIQK
ncbi:MAG: hypothetical protein U9O95_03915 [Candidatus Marinimicrobia bacterium]|nr:hypothetical protein [Candidatus Neomarinimicrobiota bacterium]